MLEHLSCPHCFAPFMRGCQVCPRCGRSVENKNPHGALPFGAVLLKKYVIASFITVDGEGIVYQAYQCTSKESVFIKEYLPITLSEDRTTEGEVNPKQGSGVMFKTTRMDFADLYRALQNITPATGLQAVVDVIECNNTVYAVLEALDGMPLNAYLKEQTQGSLLPEKAFKLLAPVFEGVSTMHATGLIHRGISPENIMVLPDGTTCLTGYATIGLRTIGTALRSQVYEGYSAPEQYATAEFEGRYTDVYCLAAVYYYLITGQVPVSAGQRLVVDTIPNARALAPSTPRYLAEVLALAMRIKPAERMQTVGDLSECLASQEAAKALLFEVKRKKKKKKKIAITGPIGVLILLAATLLCFAGWHFLSHAPVEEEEIEVTPEVTATAEPSPEVVLVDKFVGLLYSQLIATSAYNDKYLFYVAEEQYSDEVAGTVLSQIPAAGEALGEDVTVELVISKGPELVEIPQVFGFTQDSAETELTNAGLTASFVMKVNDGSYASGCVIKTDPEAGSEVQANSIVTVYIAADRDVEVIATPEPTATPTATPTPAPTASPTPAPTPTIAPTPITTTEPEVIS